MADRKIKISKVQNIKKKSDNVANQGVEKMAVFPTVTTSKTGARQPNYGSNDTLELLKVIPTKVVENNLDEVLTAVKIVDNLCDYDGCKVKTSLMGDNCLHCTKRYCFKHCLPEVHGCGEAVKHKERKEFLHNNIKPVKLVRQEANKEQAKKQLKNKLLQMQTERKKKTK